MGWYPVHVQLEDAPCVVVGGGQIAARKVDGLRAAGASVTVISPQLSDSLVELLDAGEIKWVSRAYEKGDLDGFLLAITATDDPAVNEQVYIDGEAAGLLVNSADDPANCRFILPSLVRRGDLVITASTGGRSPAAALYMRRKIEAEFGDEFGVLVSLLAEVRDAIRAQGISSEGLPWQEAISDDVLASIRQGDLDGAKRRIEECLSS